MTIRNENNKYVCGVAALQIPLWNRLHDRYGFKLPTPEDLTSEVTRITGCSKSEVKKREEFLWTAYNYDTKSIRLPEGKRIEIAVGPVRYPWPATSTALKRAVHSLKREQKRISKSMNS